MFKFFNIVRTYPHVTVRQTAHSYKPYLLTATKNFANDTIKRLTRNKASMLFCGGRNLFILQIRSCMSQIPPGHR